MRRRALLAVAAAATSGTTGCLEADTDDGTPASADDTPTPTDGVEDSTPTGGDGTGSADDTDDDGDADDDAGSDDGGSENGDSQDDDSDDSGGSADDADDGTDADADSDDDGDGTDGDDGTDGEDGETETPESTPGETRLVDQEMVVHETACGSGANHYEVDVDDGVVTVDGTIRGYNSCYTARIDESEYDGEADVLAVVVESFDDSEGTEMCAECIVDVDYEATFSFEGGEPGDVSVEHDD